MKIFLKVCFYVSSLMLIAGLANALIRTVKPAAPTEKGAARRGSGSAGIAVEVAPFEAKDLIEIGQFTGTILPKAQFNVASKVAGRLKKLNCDTGDIIEKGQVVAEIEDDEFVQALAQADAELAIAKANQLESEALLDIGRREFERVKAMRSQKVSSEAEVEAAEAQLKSREARHQVNRAQVAQRESLVKAAKIRLGYTKVDAVWSGNTSRLYVGARFQDEGAMLSQNAPIISVFDLTTVIAVIEVIEKDYYKISQNQEVEITTNALTNRTFIGKVARIAPFLNDSTRQARVEIEIANPDVLLKPGMFVNAKITYSLHAGANAVPSGAIAYRNGISGVFLVQAEVQKAHFVPVQVGVVQQGFAEIASPALSGQVVTLGHHLLEDGSAILLPGAPPLAESAGKASGDAGSKKGKGKGKGKGGEPSPEKSWDNDQGKGQENTPNEATGRTQEKVQETAKP
jgi:RND family efflux transporter MFP subunit